MDKLIDRVLKYFENSSISFGKKTSIFIIAITALMLSDYYFSMTYDYHLSKKTEQLISINKLKSIYKTDTVKFNELTNIENRLFMRQHYVDKLRSTDFNFDIPKFNMLCSTHKCNTMIFEHL